MKVQSLEYDTKIQEYYGYKQDTTASRYDIHQHGRITVNQVKLNGVASRNSLRMPVFWSFEFVTVSQTMNVSILLHRCI